MTASGLADYLDRLESAAKAANVEEEAYRKEALDRVKELERQRAYAFRRLYLVRTMAASLEDAKDADEAVARGSSVFLREVNWTGGTEAQREVVRRFTPVVMALWAIRQSEAGQPDAVAEIKDSSVEKEFVAFEAWYAGNRNTEFLSLMDAEPIDLPLVEV